MAVRTLLIVESPGSESGRLRQLACGAGFKVATTNSGSMTRSVVRRSQPDLVLISPETSSPGPSEIARSLKEDPKTAGVPVFILVNHERQLKHVYPTEASATVDADDDELVSTMRFLARGTKRARVHVQPASPLEGHLDVDSFPEVLQFLFSTQKTGRITIQNGRGQRGRIYIERGNVVHAEDSQRRGLDAFQSMCFSTQGRFTFEPDARTSRHTMEKSGMELLLESARAKDLGVISTASVKRQRSYRPRGSSFVSLTSYDDSPPARKKPRPRDGWLTRLARVLGH